MSQPVTIVLLGDPVPFARTRIDARGSLFTPRRQRNAAAALRIAAQQAMLQAQHPIFDEPLKVELLAEFPIRTSWTKIKKAAAMLGAVRPGVPDIDNIYKLAADAMNRVVYRDDSLVAEVHMRKRYGLQPKVVITVSPIDAIGKAA